jgi:hypothetical protein
MTPPARSYPGQYRNFLEGQCYLGERGHSAMDFPSVPTDAMTMIVERLKQNDSDSQTDYYASSAQKNVILVV